MAFWDTLFGGGQQEAYGDVASGLQDAQKALTDQYQQGRTDLQGAYTTAAGGLSPYLQAGSDALGRYQTGLSGMADPQAYYNQVMGGYQESPYAKYQQEQAIKAGTSAGTASGTLGSGELGRKMQEQASAISSKDMQDYLNSILGIQQQYLGGEAGLAGAGQGAATQTGQWGIGTGQELGQLGSQYGENLANILGQLGITQGQEDLARSGMLQNIIGTGGAALKESGLLKGMPQVVSKHLGSLAGLAELI